MLSSQLDLPQTFAKLCRFLKRQAVQKVAKLQSHSLVVWYVPRCLHCVIRKMLCEYAVTSAKQSCMLCLLPQLLSVAPYWSATLVCLNLIALLVANKIAISQAHHCCCLCFQAAVTVARRVAQEWDCELGQEVGYAVRFEERASSKTRIKYLTGNCLAMLYDSCSHLLETA